MDHQEAWELLPWYVNGTLEGEERAALEAWIAGSPLLQAELRVQQRLAREVTEVDVADAAQERIWDGLAQTLAREAGAGATSDGAAAGELPPLGEAFLTEQATPAPRRPAEHRDARRLGDRRVSWRGAWRAGGSQGGRGQRRLILPAAIAAGLAVLIAVNLPTSPVETTFETLTTPDAASNAASDAAVEAARAGAHLRIKAGPEASPEAIAALASEAGLIVVEGPSPTGVYTLVSPDGADLEALADGIAARPEVVFVTVRNAP
ncbi:MAG: hypothetical protein AAF675_17145 [Pseudomonadota bacterium]